MTCKQVQRLLVACWGEVEQLEPEAAEHLRECEACQREAKALRATHRLMRQGAQEPVPTGFAGRVMAEVRTAQPARVGWYQRTLGWLSPPAPAFEWARAAAVGLALVLLFGGGIALYHGVGGAPEPGSRAVIVTDTSPAVPGSTATVDLETLVLQHETLAMTQTLSEDADVHLVSYSY
jgi:anti-sigma factor RsiW